MWLQILPLVLGLASSVHGQNRPTINTSGGQVQGTTDSCGMFCTFYSFKGIPYAEPPLGALRFTDPVPHAGWTGVRDGAAFRSTCPSPDAFPTEAEDCLFVNVYSPSLIGTRPVMVFVHGGAFITGSGDADLYGAKHFMTEDVVVVTMNYRLGLLGFLSTGDQNASGNWALKDCVEALRWVQRNILAFGGDPSNVTIFGQSAGAAMVHLLTLSQLTTGLFKRAILHSGSAFSPWALQPNPRQYAERLSTALGISSTDMAALVATLRQLPFRDLIALQNGAMESEVPISLRPFAFAPVVEPASVTGSVAIDRMPMELIESESYETVPMIVGFTNMESLSLSAGELSANSGLFDLFNKNPYLLVPFYWNIQQDTVAATAVSQAFQQFYWQSQPLSTALIAEFSLYLTDHHFAYPAMEMAKRHANRSPVYVYQFSYDGDLNLFKHAMGITVPGAVHGDDLYYLFEATAFNSSNIPTTSHAFTVRSRMLRMWTNFARVGNPTPSADSLLQSITWSPISPGSISAGLNIGHNLEPGPNPIGARYNRWQELAQSYGNNIFRV